jgi:Alpha-L-arabinofuranosidase B (ABFB) domain
MYFSFESVNIDNHFIRHQNSLGEITLIQPDSVVDREDATFSLGNVPTIDRPVWFRPVNFPLHVLRHQDFRIKLHEWNPPLMPSPPLGGRFSETPEQQLLREDATFIVRRGLADSNAFSFESFNFPSHFIRHSDFHLFIAKNDNSDLFRKDATYRQRPPFAPPSPVIVH